MQLQFLNQQVVEQALSMPDLEATLYAHLFDGEEAERLFQDLAQTNHLLESGNDYFVWKTASRTPTGGLVWRSYINGRFFDPQSA